MPFYEYQCAKCSHVEEVLQKISDKPLKKCPACGKLAMNKLVSAAAFRLKGGGWYETDFKSGSKKNLEGKNAADAPGDKKAAQDNQSKGNQAAGNPAAGKKKPGGSTKNKKVKG